MEVIYLGRRNYSPENRNKKPPRGLYALWRRVIKVGEKKAPHFIRNNSFNTRRTTLARASSYDPTDYAQNFDRGTDPDNISRSFSARFADPSPRLYVPKDLLIMDY